MKSLRLCCLARVLLYLLCFGFGQQSGSGEPALRTASSTDDRPPDGARGPQVSSGTTAVRPRVLALMDHITCLRQKNLRCRDDVTGSGDHVTSSSAPEPAADDRCVNGERRRAVYVISCCK